MLVLFWTPAMWGWSSSSEPAMVVKSQGRGEALQGGNYFTERNAQCDSLTFLESLSA